MTLSWRRLHAAIRDLSEPGPDTGALLLAVERGLPLPLSEADAFTLGVEVSRHDPTLGTDAALAWSGRLLPGAQLQVWNIHRDERWSATVIRRGDRAAASALARTPAFALVKATVEALTVPPEPGRDGPEQ